MEKDKSRLRQELRRVEKSRWKHVAKILAEDDPLRPGSFVVVKRKCGKPNCRCATGEGHPAKYLSMKEKGRTRMVYVPPAIEGKVAKEARLYRQFRQSRATLEKLAKQSIELIDALQKNLETKENIATRKKKNISKRKSVRRED